MTRHRGFALLGALSCCAGLMVPGAGGETVRQGSLQVSFGGSVSPHLLPRVGTTPIAVTIRGHVRALADDQEAGLWCGVKLRATGTLVYAGSGAFAGLAGVLIAVVGGPNPADMIVLFLRGLAIAVVGGLRSLPLAFLGAFMFGLFETALIVGLFGRKKK